MISYRSFISLQGPQEVARRCPVKRFCFYSKFAIILDYSGTWLFCISQGGLDGRLEMVRGKASTVQDRVRRIEAVAREKGYSDILAILNEPCEEL